MRFTVELSGWDLKYRLHKDGTWRHLENHPNLSPADFQTDKRQDVLRQSKSKGTIELDGNLPEIEPEITQLGPGSKHLWYSSMVYRDTFPVKPQVEQLRKTIQSGDDSCNNSLILNVYGQFKLRPRPPFNIHQNDPTIVARDETSMAGNGYVGPKAAGDNKYIKDLCLMFMECWLAHLKEGRTRIYRDFPASKTQEQIDKELSQLQTQWTAQY